jgi:hypothetical protein
MENGPPEERTSHAHPPKRRCVRFLCNAGFVLCFALVVRGGAVLLMSGGLQNDPDAYWRLAANLVEHGTFGDGDVPTAYRPPLYPLTLTGCVVLGEHGRAAVGVLHALLGIATVGIVLVLGRWWGLGRRGSAIAALLVACDPILLAGSAQVMTETLATFLATAGLLALTWAGRGQCSTAIAGGRRPAECAETTSNSPRTVGSRLLPNLLRQLTAAIALALAALCRPAFLLWTLAAGIVLWWKNYTSYNIANDNSRGPTARGSISIPLSFPWAFGLGALLVLCPWAIRNQIDFGRPIVTTTHGGYTLLLANNPQFYDWLREGAWGSVWQGDQFNADWNRRRPMNEIEADRQAYAEAKQTIRGAPGTFFHACLVRIGRFWSPLPHQLTPDETPLRRMSRYAVGLWYIAEFVLVIVGFCRMAKISPHLSPACLWGLLLIGCLMAGHVVYWTDMRMRAPVMPVVAIIAASGLLFRRQSDD